MTTTKPVVDSLTTQGKGMPENDVPPQTIIPPGKFATGGIVPDLIVTGLASLPLPGEHIIPIKVDGGAEGIIRLDVPIKTTPAFDEFVAAEQRRQVVQAESMVNLAIGVVLARQGQTSIGIAKQDLLDFQQNYTVNQQIGEDGGFIITVTPKE